jgi:tetratricopeptide (TPR) repeat protein
MLAAIQKIVPMKIQFTLVLFFLTTLLFSQNDSIQMVNLENKVSFLESKIEQTEANQLNYRIEKDLLKETYSNNYSRIQTIITIVLGLISILGFLGINSIINTKKEYENELKEFSGLKIKFESDYNNLKNYQESFDKQINEINSLNQEQDKKLKILDVKEKANINISNGNYLQALEYITIGLELEPKYNNLRHLKALTYFRMQQYEDAIKVNKSILDDEPKNSSSLYDLSELLLITERNDEFIELRENYKTELNVNYDNPRSVYLQALYLYNLDKTKKIIEITDEFVANLEENSRKIYMDWDFTDIRRTFKGSEEERAKKLNYLINILGGNWSKANYKKQLEKDNK